MTYSAEFPDFDLDVTIPDGFIDQSWHNDAMPKFVCELPNDRALIIWLDYADRLLSDWPETYPRFMCELINWDGQYFDTLSSDNWDDILKFIAEYK